MAEQLAEQFDVGPAALKAPDIDGYCASCIRMGDAGRKALQLGLKGTNE